MNKQKLILSDFRKESFHVLNLQKQLEESKLNTNRKARRKKRG